MRERPEPGVWQLAWPTAAMMAMQAGVMLVDFLVVGELGKEAVAAVGAGGQMHWLQFALLASISTGTVAMVSRAVGAGDHLDADRTLRASLLAAALLGLLFMTLIPFGERLVGLFGVVERVRVLGGDYLRILFAFSVPLCINLTFYSALRAAGDVRTPLFIGATVNLVNVVGDYALVFGLWGAPRLGVAGAAWASGIALGVGAVMGMGLWLRGSLVLRRRGWLGDLQFSRLRRLLRIGLPAAAEQVVFNLGILLFTRIIAEFGTPAVTAYFIGVRLLMFAFVPGIAFQVAASTLVGQNLGGQRPEFARRAGWRAVWGAAAVMSAVGAAVIGGAELLAGWFSATGSETIELTIRFIWILGAAQPLIAVEFALGGALRGAGDTRFPLVTVLTGLFGGRLLAAWLLIAWLDVGVVPVWCCLLLDYAVKAAMLIGRFRSDSWERVVV